MAVWGIADANCEDCEKSVDSATGSGLQLQSLAW